MILRQRTCLEELFYKDDNYLRKQCDAFNFVFGMKSILILSMRQIS